LLASVFLVRSALAEDAYVVRRWTPNEGLPTSTVNDTAQSADGSLWVATPGGLARVDGVRFETFGVRDSLPSNRFSGVLPARDGTVYAVTEDGWFCHWDGTRFTTVDLHRRLGSASMVEAPDGTVFGASGTTLWRYRQGRLFLYPDSALWNSRVVVDRTGAVWLTSTFGSSPFVEMQQSVPSRVEGDGLRRIGVPTREPGLWIADRREGDARYFQSRGGDARLFDPSQRLVATLAGAGHELPHVIDASGRLWTTSGPDVIVRSAADGRELRRYRLGLSERAPRIFVDKDGNLWVCTVTQGLIRVAPSPLQLLRPANTETALEILWMRELADGTVLATDFSWNAWRAAEDRLLPTPGGPFANGGPGSWAVSGASRYRVGKDFLEIRGANGTGGIAHNQFTTQYLVPDAGEPGSVLAYTDKVYRYTPVVGGLRETTLLSPRQELRHLFFDRRKHLWVATAGGVWRIAPGDTAFFTRKDGLPIDHVRQIHEDPDGVIWLGTYGGGLVRYKDGKFATLDKRQGLIEDVVSVVLEDEYGELWLAGNAGIQHFPRAQANAVLDGKRTRVDAIGLAQESGLRNPEGSGQPGLKSRDGRLWFPTFDGVAVVDPRLARALDKVPPVPHIEAVTAADHALARGAHGFTVPARAGRFVVNYTGFDLRAAEQLRFAYRLEGVDRDWIQAGTSRTAIYTNVPPGRHVFRLMAYSALGQASTRADAVTIEVQPQVWQTRWFLALAALALGALLVVGWKQRGRTLQARARELQAAVTERTAELATEKLTVEAQAKRLEALDRARSRFFASVSHEFRTPLTLIHGPLQDVRSGLHGPVPPEAEQQVNIALDSVGRLNRLVDQLLDAARAEAGELKVERRPRDLALFLEHLAQSFVPLAERKGITFTRQIPEGPRLASFDREALEKVFANLLGNAFKFTPAGGHVTLSAGLVTQNVIEIVVEDDGPGIAAEDLPHVFKRFYRPERSVTRVQPGTGLGLALAADMVEQHRGTIRAESVESQGSRFIVRLDLLRPDEAPELEDESPIDQSTTLAMADEVRVTPAAESVNGGAPAEDGPLVLVVDDHPDVRDYVARHLRKRYRVAIAADGNEALAAMRTETPDLVVSDVSMPGLDGYGLVSSMRRDPEFDYVPVILLTAAASTDHRVAGLEGGADDYLTKPFEMRELIARAHQALESRRRLRNRIARAAAESSVYGTPVPSHEDAVVEIPSPSRPNAVDNAFVRRIREVIEARMGDEDFEVDRLAEAMGMSRTLFYEKVADLLDQTPMALVTTYRLERAAELLRAGEGNVSEVGYAVGFRSVAHFSRKFREHHGVTPSSYRRAG
jgi:signal transduction histidine kinase/AraC-like DNA-binding protein/ligand-binding sensor domain-containing protein/FixJ family two-component response regulator